MPDIGWTSTERRYRTPYGDIYYGGPCRDNYRNMLAYNQAGPHTVFSYQRPAMRAWLAAQVRYARRSGWTKRRIENTHVMLGGKRYTEGKPIFVVAGTNRSCSLQASLYRQDPGRYAKPEYTGHTRGLAADVHQDQDGLGVIYECLAAENWERSRPDDEPWHWTYWVKV